MTKGKRRITPIDSRERLQLLIENTKEYAIIVLDPKGRIEDWNRGARHLFGYTQKEVIGKNFVIFFTHEDRRAKRPERELQQAETEGQAEDENWLVRKNGTLFWASGMTIPILDKVGNHVGFAKVVRDLTDKRELEQQKDDFIAIASHELRTPLTATSIHRQILRKHLEQNKDKKGLEYFDKITHGINQLEHLIRDLLNVTKLQTGDVGIEKETFSLHQAVKDVVEEVQRTTTNHKIVVQGSSRSNIYANKQQIEEVITNLLTNAIKYSPKAEKVVVSLKKQNHSVTVSVRDYGIGIEKKSLSRIFDRFYRTQSSKEKNLPGLGLGLYITEKIIENHRGKITVKSTPGKGSTFSLTLPI